MGFLEQVLDNVGEPYKGGGGFERGLYEIIIGEAEATQDKNNRDIIKVTVFNSDDNDQTAEATLWFHTEGGAKLSVTKILGILVHNVGEEKKEAVRELGKKLFATTNTPAEAQKIAIKLINDKLIGKKAYLLVNPKGDYKTSAYGDIWHYPAKLKDDAQAVADVVGGTVETVSDDELPDFGDI